MLHRERDDATAAASRTTNDGVLHAWGCGNERAPYTSTGMPARLGSTGALHGRNRLCAVLEALGFPLN